MFTNLLHGEKIRLTALSPDDAAAIARWQEDVGYLRLLNTDLARPRGVEEIAEGLKEAQAGDRDILFAIRPLSSHTLIGMLGFTEIEWTNQVAWVYISIGDRENWGKGYGREAMELALAYAFHELNLHRVQLTVIAYNERAIALYEGLGFTREGTFREFGQRDGRRYDMLLYGLLRPEWEARDEA